MVTETAISTEMTEAYMVVSAAEPAAIKTAAVAMTMTMIVIAPRKRSRTSDRRKDRDKKCPSDVG
jgi:hypothetical protein